MAGVPIKEREMRREAVEEYLALGMTIREIANSLTPRVSTRTVDRDIRAINKKNNKVINEMAKQGLITLFQSCLRSHNKLLTQCWSIYSRDNGRFPADQQVNMNIRMRALELIDRITSNKFNVINNGPAMMEINRLESKVANLERGIDIGV